MSLSVTERLIRASEKGDAKSVRNILTQTNTDINCKDILMKKIS